MEGLRRNWRKKKPSYSSLSTMFMHADAIDVLLMSAGCLASAAGGISPHLSIFLASKVMNTLAGAVSTSDSHFIHSVHQNSMNFLYLAGGLAVAGFFQGFCWTRTAERQTSRMRAQYLRAILRQDMEYFDLKVASINEAVTSVSDDSLIIQDFIGEKIPNFVQNCTTFVGGYIASFVLMWRLALVAMPTMVLLVVPAIIFGRILVRLARKIREEYSKAGGIAEQAVSSIRTVYSFVGEQRTMVQFSVALEGSFKLGLRQGLIKGMTIGTNAVSFAIWTLIIWYGSRVVMYHGAKGGTVFAVGSSIMEGSLAFGSALSHVRSFSEAVSAAERMSEIIRRVPKIDSECKEGEVVEDVAGELKFTNVEFSYPSRPETTVLSGFNLKIPAGKTVAMVGESGSGKSTVIALLERFYNPTKGEVSLDGVDISKLQLKWLRSQMGLVSQEPALFATSVKENMLLGKEDASMEEVVAAAKVANAHDFISQLPEGYDTQVGERGIQISGGQKQRIAIARAVLKAPKILLLDEATSALDSESERIVQGALDAASFGRTTVVIAHRLSTIRNADFIAVVQAGRIAESGSHDDLIKDEDGIYTSLVRLQHTKMAKESKESLTTSTPKDLKTSHRFSTRSQLSSVRLDSKTEPTTPTPALARPPSLGRLLTMNAAEWKHGVVGWTCAALSGGIEPIFNFAMGNIITMYFLKDHKEIEAKTRMYCFWFLTLSMFVFVVNFSQHFSFGAMGEHLTKRVRERMLSKILTFELAWFDMSENSTGAICARLATDASVVRSLVGDRMSLLVQTASAIIISGTMGLIISWRLALVMIVIQPLMIMCFYGRNVLLKSMFSRAAKAQSESSKLAAEAVSNLPTITAFSSQSRVFHLFRLAQEGPRRESLRQSWFAGLVLIFSNSLTKCANALGFWFGGRLMAQGDITAKAIFQTQWMLMSTGRIIATAGSMTSDLAKGAEAVSSVFAILDRNTCIESEDPKGHRPENINGSIDFHEVEFAYPSRPNVLVFKNFSLDIEVGKSTALVGHSGSGKSTIIALIERFYDPTKGEVRIDGINVKEYHLRSLRRHIALVSQEPTLFAGTVRNNIKYGVEEATEAEVEAAARAAGTHEFVSGLKDGYETWCGERGAQLSGGQRQRIAIARAILKKPTILLLDEATSALDSLSEKTVQTALEKMMAGRTCVMVAHRLSSIQKCDLIVVLEKGEVAEKGSHGSLLAKGGAYFGLVNLQQGSKSLD